MQLKVTWQLQPDMTNMLYNLRNGSTISLPLDRYLDMTDADLEKLELYTRGAEINDPFFGSVLVGKPKAEVDEELVEEEDEVLPDEPDL